MNAQQIEALKALMPDVPADELEALIERYTGAATMKARAEGLRYKATDAIDAIADRVAGPVQRELARRLGLAY